MDRNDPPTWPSQGKMVRPDPAALTAALLAAAAILGFFLFAARAAGGALGRVDAWILQALRDPADPSKPLGPTWLEAAAVDVTALGGYTVLSLFVAFGAGYLLVLRRYGAGALVAFSAIAGAAMNHGLKAYYARPRPVLVPHLVRVSTESFPSGHAMLAAVVYLTLGALLAQAARGWWARLYVVGAAAAVTGLVGASRVYLGVHYPTDVAAGWMVGGAWALVCWLVARTLRRAS